MPDRINRPGSQAWGHSVNTMLKSGLGVYDIALKMKCSVTSVRIHVKMLRRNGILKYWFKK